MKAEIQIQLKNSNKFAVETSLDFDDENEPALLQKIKRKDAITKAFDLLILHHDIEDLDGSTLTIEVK